MRLNGQIDRYAADVNLSTSAPVESRHYPSAKTIWISATVFVVVGAIALLVLPNLLLQNWFPGSSENERRRLLGSAAQIVLFALGGFIAVVGVALSVSRHGQELDAAARDRSQATRMQQAHEAEIEKEVARRHEVEIQRSTNAERELRGRFVAAMDLLSADDSPTRRAAALYALAALADDWDVLDRSDEVQICIDVICGYLRAPQARPDDATSPAEIMVRIAGYETIRRHLHKDVAHSWSGHRIRLGGAHVDFVADLSQVVCSGVIDLSGVYVTDRGRLRLNGSTISRNGRINLRDAIVKDNGAIDFSSVALIDNSTVNLRGIGLFGKSNVYLRSMEIGSHARVNLLTAEISDDAKIHLRGMNVAAGGKLSLSNGQTWMPEKPTVLTASDLPRRVPNTTGLSQSDHQTQELV